LWWDLIFRFVFMFYLQFLLMALPWLSHSIAISASWRLFVHVFTWMD
jgi:hypothetical protein